VFERCHMLDVEPAEKCAMHMRRRMDWLPLRTWVHWCYIHP